jgi:hypothetical protein
MPETDSLVERWRAITRDAGRSWALFANGTCVLFEQGEGEPAARATALLKEWGPVQVATPSADFAVVDLPDALGWLVTCHHPDILTYVGPEELAGRGPDHLLIGLLGRSKRDRDAHELEIIGLQEGPAGDRPSGPAEPCDCLVTPPGRLDGYRELGMDRHYGEASILVCPDCGRYWLRYFYEVEAFPASSRWYLGLIGPELAGTLTAGDAKATLESLEWYYYGGRYFRGLTGKSSGPIYLNP